MKKASGVTIQPHTNYLKLTCAFVGRDQRLPVHSPDRFGLVGVLHGPESIDSVKACLAACQLMAVLQRLEGSTWTIPHFGHFPFSPFQGGRVGTLSRREKGVWQGLGARAEFFLLGPHGPVQGGRR